MFGFFGGKKAKTKASTDFLSYQDVQNMVESGEAILVDIREDNEYESEHIKGSISWPLSRFDVNALAAQAGDKKIIIHCATGVRAKAACFTLKRETGKVAYRMESCLSGWKRAGMPTEK